MRISIIILALFACLPAMGQEFMGCREIDKMIEELNKPEEIDLRSSKPKEGIAYRVKSDGAKVIGVYGSDEYLVSVKYQIATSAGGGSFAGGGFGGGGFAGGGFFGSGGAAVPSSSSRLLIAKGYGESKSVGDDFELGTFMVAGNEKGQLVVSPNTIKKQIKVPYQREWTNKIHGSKLTATFYDFEKGVVTLMKPDNSTVEIKVIMLSDDDASHVRKLLSQRRKQGREKRDKR